jgi:hypothetical protein
MPYCRCPACHQLFHLLVRENVESWYGRWAPGLDRDEFVPMLCFKCWQQARSGSLQLEELNVPAQLLGRLRDQLSISDETEEPSPDDLVTLFRPTGPAELELVRESGYRRWPPRLPDQPIFCPVTNERYAAEIASKWNTEDGKSGFVTKFQVRAEFMRRYELHQVGAAHHTEWWVPAAELDDLNDNIVGLIEVVAEYPAAG